jgi:putative membrane protein
MAAERTVLAWIRTGIALMGFGFIVARFGLFLRELTLSATSAHVPRGAVLSMPIGIALILIGIATLVGAATRHQRYIRALDDGQFRIAFNSRFVFSLVALLALLGIGMAGFLLSYDLSPL